MWQQYLDLIKKGDTRSLARCISLVENEAPGYEELLRSLPANDTPVTGITGPPGAGKSTLTDALIGSLIEKNKKIAVLCIDPSSPFNSGALLGDRIRMNRWYNSPQVFIRSLATRGSLGGLHPKIIEITDILKASGFDHVIIETVGVGQSEIEIAGLADTTVVVLVPESGDDIQSMKSGLMEIADIFVVNKSDRPDADAFVKNLRLMLSPDFHAHDNIIPVIKTVASKNEGTAELLEEILKHGRSGSTEKKTKLLADKAYHLIREKRMNGIDKNELLKRISEKGNEFNLYSFIEKY